MVFSEHEKLTASEMSTMLDINISSVYRIVNTMRELGFAEQILL